MLDTLIPAGPRALLSSTTRNQFPTNHEEPVNHPTQNTHPRRTPYSEFRHNPTTRSNVACAWIDFMSAFQAASNRVVSSEPASLGQALVEGPLLRQLSTQLEMAELTSDVRQRPTGSDRRVGG
jgi:hypothetical protein